ncbi:hypothetical protein NDU88_005107 [Pleurodeles waltl]|uniref:Uncharacterized protein n=1 Tax=Pleurodeles waltl TaxID=8319 RepID=A0AAV7UI84_PLEWA|nr:hypothetical protein NDU88_005107 [Pleurodeles waltl]
MRAASGRRTLVSPTPWRWRTASLTQRPSARDRFKPARVIVYRCASFHNGYLYRLCARPNTTGGPARGRDRHTVSASFDVVSASALA